VLRSSRRAFSRTPSGAGETVVYKFEDMIPAPARLAFIHRLSGTYRMVDNVDGICSARQALIHRGLCNPLFSGVSRPARSASAIDSKRKGVLPEFGKLIFAKQRLVDTRRNEVNEGMRSGPECLTSLNI